jgi:hypothetical protein
MSTAKAPRRFPARACIPPADCRCERTHGGATASPGVSRQAGNAACRASPAPAGHSRRNAVGRVGVKLGAAPDAPHWGKVLVRSLSDRFSSSRWRATSKFTCLSREYPLCPALHRNPGGAGPRPRWPASSGGGGRRGQTVGWPEAGLRIARQPAWAVCKAEMAVNTARKTRQRASAGRTCGGDPHPGKDPL